MNSPRCLTWLLCLAAAGAITCRGQDPLDSWARRIVPGFTANLHAVAYGNGVFVAVGDNSTVARSTDGAEWTITTPGAYGNLARVRFLNDVFMVVGSSDKLLLSPDGANWTAVTLPIQGFWDVAYNNGTYVLAGSSLYVSTNGLNWTAAVARLNATPIYPARDFYADSVAYGNGRFVAIPGMGSQPWPHSVWSSNGIDWTEGSNAPNSSPVGRGDLLFAAGILLAAGNTVGSSTDGTGWCCVNFSSSSFTFHQAVGLAYGEGTYLWVHHINFGNRLHPYIYSSTNGTAWVTRFAHPDGIWPLPGTPSEVVQFHESMKGQARGAAFGNGTFVIVGEAGYIVQSGNLGGAPLIILQPHDRGAVGGNPASFSVHASGAGPLAYQWFHNDNAIANATNVLYTISAVSANAAGGYKVVITNSYGSVTSRVAQLSVSFLDIKSYAGIELLGLVGRTYRIEATPASGAVNWQTLTNVVLPTSPYIWIDYGSPAAGQRLYRAAELP